MNGACTADKILTELRSRGVRVEIGANGKLRLAPARAIEPALLERVREQKAELVALLRALPAEHRAAWTQSVTPDARHPIIPPEVRAKIETIEMEARLLGWPAELLWNAGFWDCPRGIAALLDADDEIAEVTPDYIGILKTRRDLLKFRRHVG